MTHKPNIARHAHRRATALLLAAVAIPSTVYAQETVAPPVIPAPIQAAPVAPPLVSTSTPASPPAGESRTTIAPGVAEQAAEEARERAAARRAEAQRAAPARPAPVARAAAPAPVADPAPVSAPADVAPAAAQPVPPPAADPAAAPVAETVPPAPVDADPAEAPGGDAGFWLMLAGFGLAAAAIAAFLLLRRRRDVVDEPAYVEPEMAAPEPAAVHPRPVADPVAAAPMFTAAPVAAHVATDTSPEPVQAALENVSLTTPDKEDLAAVLGDGAGQGDRPQLELAMRPMRAGVNRDEAIVEFELTVANAGGVPARDVRIGAFMLSDRPGQRSDIERLLVDPPADHIVPADTIDPGDGKRLDAAVTLPRDDLHLTGDADHDGFRPIVLADARYRLPDGREGRTAAAFTIGRVNGGDRLVPISIKDDPAMYADIEARLHSVAAKA